MLVAGLLRHDRIPRHARADLRDGPARIVGEFDASRRDHRHFLVAQKHDVARVRKDGGDVGGDEELTVAETDDDRRAVPDRDDLVRVVGGNEHQREQPAHVEERAPHGVLEAVILHLALDEVRDDLGIGLRDEPMAFGFELTLQVEVILDDAVVHDDDPSRAIAVRVRVLLGRTAVRRPPRVADAVLAVDRVDRDGFLQPRQLAGAAPQLDRAVADDGDARRVVAAILQAAETVDQDRKDLLLADIPDDPAHGCISRGSIFSSWRPTRPCSPACPGRPPARPAARPR